jgi:hypothetical protein
MQRSLIELMSISQNKQSSFANSFDWQEMLNIDTDNKRAVLQLKSGISDPISFSMIAKQVETHYKNEPGVLFLEKALG